jgi:Protein of unknown function (DUF3775)
MAVSQDVRRLRGGIGAPIRADAAHLSLDADQARRGAYVIDLRQGTDRCVPLHCLATDGCRRRKQAMPKAQEETPAELNVSLEKVCYIIVKAREFDAKVDPVEPDPGSNPADDDEREVLEDYADDPTLAELRAAIDGLNDDEVIDTIALAWLGRGDFGKEDWSDVRELARERHRRHSADYLVGMPALGDYLEEGLAVLGHSCEDYDSGRL